MRFDRLPAELLGAVEAALVRAPGRGELLRALGVALDALLREAGDAQPEAQRVAGQLRELTAPSLEAPSRP